MQFIFIYINFISLISLQHKNKMFCSQKFNFFVVCRCLFFGLLSCSSLKFSFGLINIKCWLACFKFAGFVAVLTYFGVLFYWLGREYPSSIYNETFRQTDSQTLIVCRSCMFPKMFFFLCCFSHLLLCFERSSFACFFYFCKNKIM